LTALTARPEVHSVGLDEAVRLETDADGDGTLTALAVLAAALGKALELSAFTPFGEREIRVDSAPPVVEQVRGAAGELVIEVSEEVSAQALAQTLATGDFRLVETAGETALGIEVAQPVDSASPGSTRGQSFETGASPPLW